MQAADARPDPTLHRKAAIVAGAALEHTGEVSITPIPDFDLDRTIFKTLEGAPQRFVMTTRVAKHVDWAPDAAARVATAYDAANTEQPLPEVSPELLQFMVQSCDFDVEHADGSFLDHLYFCFEYTARHYPEQSPVVMLLHSILGTGTNTFAMTADKIPALKALVSDDEWAHIEAFPSVLRSLYDGRLREELEANLHRIDQLTAVKLHRVIDNAPIELSAAQLWPQLNFQLIHLVDFLPVANWSTHLNDTSFILFRALHRLLSRAGKLEARVDYTPADGPRGLTGEQMRGFAGWLTTLIPVAVSEKMAARSVRRFSEVAGHDLSYELVWAS